MASRKLKTNDSKETSFLGRSFKKLRGKDSNPFKAVESSKELKNNFCTTCGKRTNKLDKYCPDCGKYLFAQIEQSKLKKYKLSRILEGFFISIGLAFLYGIISIIPNFFLASKNLPDKYYLISMLGVFTLLVALTFVFSFRKKARRSSAIFLLFFLLLGTGVGYALEREVKTFSCKYAELNEEGMKSILNDYRRDNGKNNLENNDGLDSYAKHKTEELADKTDSERKEKIINDFGDWYNANIEEQKRMRWKAVNASYVNLASNPCVALDAIKRVKSFNDNSLDNKFTHFGIATKDDFVYIIFFEENRDPILTPTPKQAKQNYQQKQTSCDESKKNEQYWLISQKIAKLNKNILDYQSRIRELEAELQKPEPYEGYYESIRKDIDNYNMGISGEMVNIRYREDELEKVKQCKLFSDQWIETANKYW